MVNIAVSAPTTAGYIRVTPAGLNPGISTQQFARGQSISNLVAVKLVGGKIQIKVSAGSARITMDISGYFRPRPLIVTPPSPVAVTPPSPVTVTPPNPVTVPPVLVDVTAPGPVTGLSTSQVGDTSVALVWSNPTDADFTGVTIRRAAGATAPATITDGTPVTVATSATATSGTDGGLTAGTQYSYAVFAHDGVPNYAAAAKVTTWTTGGTAAVLSVSSEGIDTTRIPVGTPLFFDVSGSTAGPAGVTTKTVVLDYGDGTAPLPFSGDSTSWFGTHTYAAVGTYPATLTVTDSAHVTVSTVVTVTVSAAPTAAITMVGNPTSVQVGVPVTFTLTTSTPPGTAIKSWTVNDVWLDGGYGSLPPATVTHTFDAPGTYTVNFDFTTDAPGLAQSSVEVTVLP